MYMYVTYTMNLILNIYNKNNINKSKQQFTGPADCNHRN